MLNRHEQLLGIEVQKAHDVSATLRRFWNYFGPYRIVLIVVGLILVAGTYMQVLIPDLIGQAVDCYLGPVAAQSLTGDLDPALLDQLRGGIEQTGP